ncbi:MAG: cobalamin biosynthesis protein [Muribaculaceae bacterium]|nr:cobalamin biosynthesis protein [Alistipes senegalensis]MCM1472673.1 cobalamin biosynthesis protein [Muribaculaceae bacterium]
MNILIVSLTEKGRILSRKIPDLLRDFHNFKRYCFRKHTDNCAESFDNLSELIGKNFNIYDGIIFICSCGIAVRVISPHIISKVTDPAVIVIDDSGKFIIPVLSGHIGGANRLSEILAEKLSAIPVITTATDTGSRFSPDSFAVANNLFIEDIKISKIIASEILDNKKIGLKSDYKYINIPPEITSDKNCSIGIYIGNSNIKPFPVTLRLIPKNIVIGVGCRRGTPCGIIEKRINESLISAGISPERVSGLATVDIKSGETGILEYCRKKKIIPEFYSAEELMAVSGEFTSSDFVRKTTGADNICERSAVKSGGRLIIGKNSGEGVTVAVAEKDFIIDFERKIL